MNTEEFENPTIQIISGGRKPAAIGLGKNTF